MLPLLAVTLIIFAAGFGGGYLMRHLISRHRHREVMRRRHYGIA